MKQENRSFAFVVVVFALLNGLIGLPHSAKAFVVAMEVNWEGDAIPYNIHPVAELLKSDESSFDPPIEAELFTFDNDYYEIGFWNPPSTVALVKYHWTDEGYGWSMEEGDAFPDGTTIEANWSGTLLEVWAVDNRASVPANQGWNMDIPFQIPAIQSNLANTEIGRTEALENERGILAKFTLSFYLKEEELLFI